MCSICGMIDFNNRDNISEKLVREMGEKLAHRGPDQNGVYVTDQVAFQHNRLAIMDVDHGLQPMTRRFMGKEYTIVYNGEIYNAPELSRDLAKHGIKLETTCDTEVVLYTYIVYKEACAEKLNGIFAFAVLDSSEDKVYIARDRFGIKPLFYTQLGTTLLFASEVKALLAHPKVEAIMDQEGLWQLLYLAPNKINGTSVFKNILEVPPSNCGIYRNATLTLRTYWKLEAKDFTGTREDAIEQTREILTDAIKRQLVSDVPLATLLSGGLDSSIISAVAAEHYRQQGQKLNTYSFEYKGNKENFKQTLFQPQSDDDFAVYLAKELGTQHHILVADIEELIEMLYTATYYRDMPGMADIDSSLLYYCSQIKKEHTVALSGECADEIFGGYPWFYREEMLQKPFFPWIHDPFRRIELFDDKITKKDQGYAFMTEVYRNSLESCPLLDTDSDTMQRSRKATWLSVNYFMTSLLERKDRMSMAGGVEVRVPFADHRILEYVFNVPWEIKFEGNVEKALLRNAMADYLPDAILHRKKSPYPKTHNPRYEEAVTSILLKERMGRSGSAVAEMINRKSLDELLNATNVTWFGQLMSKPQLIAWLIQLDFWFETYNVKLV